VQVQVKFLHLEQRGCKTDGMMIAVTMLEVRTLQFIRTCNLLKWLEMIGVRKQVWFVLGVSPD
jgi:hypothetical protein